MKKPTQTVAKTSAATATGQSRKAKAATTAARRPDTSEEGAALQDTEATRADARVTFNHLAELACDRIRQGGEDRTAIVADVAEILGAPAAAAVPLAEFDPCAILAGADKGCAVADWEKLVEHSDRITVPHCLTGDAWPLLHEDRARLFALIFFRHRAAWQKRLARFAAAGIQPAAGALAEALAISDAIVRRELLRPSSEGRPLPGEFTLPVPGIAAQYRWNMTEACIRLAFVLWDLRDLPDAGLEFANLSPFDRAELAEAMMIVELTLNAEGHSLDGTGKENPPGKATKTQRIAWHRLTTVVGLSPAV